MIAVRLLRSIIGHFGLPNEGTDTTTTKEMFYGNRQSRNNGQQQAFLITMTLEFKITFLPSFQCFRFGIFKSRK
jgi:hypothetical protein